MQYLFNGIQVGGVGGKDDGPCTGGPDGTADGGGPVAAEVVHDDDVVWMQGWGQKLLDIGSEDLGGDRPIDATMRCDRIMTQGGNKGHGSPISEGSPADQSLAACRPAPQRCHVGLGRSPLGLNLWRLQWRTFVNKAQLFRSIPT